MKVVIQLEEIISLHILSGFLGSGKSTLLKNLVEKEQLAGKKVAILMNELGEYSVDSGIIGSDLTILELLDGCICCTIKDELEVQLLELYKKEQPDVIFIEATGVAHPVDVMEACLSPVLAPYIVVEPLVTVVDSKRWLDRAELSEPIQRLVEEQVKYADHILLNKADTVSRQEMDAVQLAIKEINPSARRSVTRFAQIDLMGCVSGRKRTGLQEREELHVAKHLHIQTMTHTFQVEIDRGDFERWLQKVAPKLFRLKGFVRFTEKKDLYLIQMAYGMPFLMPQPGRFPMTIVIIGEQLDKQKIKRDLLDLEVKEQSMGQID